MKLFARCKYISQDSLQCELHRCYATANTKHLYLVGGPRCFVGCLFFRQTQVGTPRHLPSVFRSPVQMTFRAAQVHISQTQDRKRKSVSEVFGKGCWTLRGNFTAVVYRSFSLFIVYFMKNEQLSLINVGKCSRFSHTGWFWFIFSVGQLLAIKNMLL